MGLIPCTSTLDPTSFKNFLRVQSLDVASKLTTAFDLFGFLRLDELSADDLIGLLIKA
jgi:hypothetical protein